MKGAFSDVINSINLNTEDICILLGVKRAKYFRLKEKGFDRDSDVLDILARLEVSRQHMLQSDFQSDILEAVIHENPNADMIPERIQALEKQLISFRDKLKEMREVHSHASESVRYLHYVQLNPPALPPDSLQALEWALASSKVNWHRTDAIRQKLMGAKIASVEAELEVLRRETFETL